MPRHLEHPDSRVLDLTHSPGTVHLYVAGQQVLTMTPGVAAWLAEQARLCAMTEG